MRLSDLKIKWMESHMIVIKWVKNLDFKIKIGMLFCLIPLIIWVIYSLIYFLCKCKLNSFFELPLMLTLYLGGFYENFLIQFFTCGKDSSSFFDCIVGPIIFVLLYFLTFFAVGFIVGYLIEKLKKK